MRKHFAFRAEPLRRALQERLPGKVGMPFASRRLLERIFDARAQSVFAVRRDAQRQRDPIRRHKADAFDIVDQAIGVFADLALRVRAVIAADFTARLEGTP